MCVVSGQMTVHLLTAWQRYVLLAGGSFLTGEVNPVHMSPVDLYEGVRESRTHAMVVDAGDCIFIPAYWWHQIETSDEMNTVLVTYYYDVASSWLKLVMEGIANDIL